MLFIATQFFINNFVGKPKLLTHICKQFKQMLVSINICIILNLR
jgi:hypothetical protein